MTGKLREIIPLAGGEWIVSFVTRNDPRMMFDKYNGKEITVDVKRAEKARSKNANAFCWALCAEIGKAMTPPLSKEDVYRMAIKAVGVYFDKVLPAWDIEPVRRRWEDHGTGWIFEIVDDAGVGRKLCNLYFGSSTYTVSEMKTLLEWLLDNARQMELAIPLSKQEEQEMLERWGKR